MLKKWFNSFKRGGRSTIALNGRRAPSFDAAPDLPIGFGYKMQWYAVRTMDTEGVAAHLMLLDAQPANWSSGIRAAYGGYYFVTPPVDGWTLIVNATMPGLSGNESSHTYGSLQSLSAVYGAAYYFGTQRIVGYHAWAKALNGLVVRAYGHLGESGETLADEGELTDEEIALGLLRQNQVGEEPVYRGEQDVLRLAGKWTINPLMEDVSIEPGVGIAGSR